MDIEHPDHDPEIDLSAVERRLAAWRPAAGGLDRDRMLYEAGRNAARADGRVQSWRLATAALVLMAVGLGGMLARERSQRRGIGIIAFARTRINPSHPVEEIASPASREPSGDRAVCAEQLLRPDVMARTKQSGHVVARRRIRARTAIGGPPVPWIGSRNAGRCNPGTSSASSISDPSTQH